MLQLPDTLEEATQQAIAATLLAIDSGCNRLQAEIRFPELNPLPIARSFAEALVGKYGLAWQALFADAGAAALAKRDWIDLEVSMRGVNEGRAAVQPESKAFLLVAPSAVEVDGIEKLLNLVGDRPFIMLNPKLENSEVGIGLAARRIRDRFLSRFEITYYLQPLDNGALWRSYPQAWQVWHEQNGTMAVIFTSTERPVGDALNRVLGQGAGKPPSLLAQLQQFLNALSR